MEEKVSIFKLLSNKYGYTPLVIETICRQPFKFILETMKNQDDKTSIRLANLGLFKIKESHNTPNKKHKRTHEKSKVSATKSGVPESTNVGELVE